MNDKTIPLSAASIAVMTADMGGQINIDPADRLSVDKSSPFYDLSYKRLGVRFNGIERHGDVQEYCVSEGWIIIRAKTALGKFRLNSDGTYVLKRLTGRVEQYWKDDRMAGSRAYVGFTIDNEAHEKAAEAKRQRRAERNARLAAGNPAEILREVAKTIAKEEGLTVDHQSFDDAAKKLESDE